MKNQKQRIGADGIGLPIERVLSGLDKVSETKPGQWKACCPAHDDKTPSLAIKEGSDGVVLLKCWAGCTAADITAAIGLELRDLFPRTGEQGTQRGPSKAAIRHEQAIYQIAISMQAQGCRLNEQDQARFELAKQRLGVRG